MILYVLELFGLTEDEQSFLAPCFDHMTGRMFLLLQPGCKYDVKA